MISDFDKNLNISYTDDSLPVPSKELVRKHCFCSYLVYLSIYVLLANNPFFSKYFILELQYIYLAAFLLYVIAAPIIYLKFLPKSLYNSHSIEICEYFEGLFKLIFCKNTILKQNYKDILSSFCPTYKQKQALMLIFIKVFFGTLMAKFLYDDINYAISNSNILSQMCNDINTDIVFWNFKQVIASNSEFLYRYVLNILFMVDISCFFVGYLTECTLLRNKIRTVDTNIFGVLACLICYPPFNQASSAFLSWQQNDCAMISNPKYIVLSWAFRVIALLFLTIYALASVALGTKASNLTNRGTVSRFPYSIIRHPAYISKNMFWFFTTIPLLVVDFDYIQHNFPSYILRVVFVIGSLLLWASVYYFRAITEERHLMQDPEYQEYAKKVKWRFIPFVI